MGGGSIIVAPRQRPLWVVRSTYFSKALLLETRGRDGRDGKDVYPGVAGMTWDPAARAWTGYIDACEAVANRLKRKGIRLVDSALTKVKSDDYTHRLPYAVHGAGGRMLRDYQKKGVDFLICQAPTGAILADDMGCVSGDAVVRVSQAGKSFETTLADLFRCFTDSNRRGELKIRSLCDGIFRLQPIVRVVYSGEKDVLEVVLHSCKRVQLTADHEVLTAKGFARADALRVGVEVITNGTPTCYLCKVNPPTSGKFAGTCKACIYTKLRANGRARPIGEVRDKDGYVRVAGHRNHPRANTSGQVLQHHIVMEASLGRFLRVGEVVHHRNGVKHDNRLENLELTTTEEHARHHGQHGGFAKLHGSVSAKGGRVVFVPKSDAVVSVTPIGRSHTYDVVCRDPHRNFVANGIVVHNCGKTATAIVAARAFGGKTLVVCPNSARSVWADPERGEVSKWWPKMLPFIFLPEGTAPKKPKGWAKAKALQEQWDSETPKDHPKFAELVKNRPAVPLIEPLAIPDDAQLVVIHFDILYAWVDAIIAWGVQNILIDEGHLLQNERSRRSRAAKEIRKAPSVATCMAFTGTPLTNRIRDLWNLIDTVSPGRMGKNFFKFGLCYCAGREELISRDIGTRWNFEGKSNLEELQRRLEWFTLRRTTEEVKLELPPKIRQVIRLESKTNFRAQDIDKIDKSVIQTLLSKSVDAKIPQVVAMLKDHLVSEHSTVAFCYRREVAEFMVNELAPLGVHCFFIHGGVPVARRNAIIKALHDASGPVFLAATIDCCAVAIDLTFATVGVMVELSYEPHKLLQGEKRLHRPGQDLPVLIQYPIADGTVEEAIAEVVIDRLDTFETLIGKTDGLAAALAGQEEDILKGLEARLRAMTEPAEVPTKVRRKMKL